MDFDRILKKLRSKITEELNLGSDCLLRLSLTSVDGDVSSKEVELIDKKRQ